MTLSSPRHYFRRRAVVESELQGDVNSSSILKKKWSMVSIYGGAQDVGGSQFHASPLVGIDLSYVHSLLLKTNVSVIAICNLRRSVQASLCQYSI